MTLAETHSIEQTKWDALAELVCADGCLRVRDADFGTYARRVGTMPGVAEFVGDLRGREVLEYGCGPTLHRAIAATRYAFRIDMADWLPDNLLQVREWLTATAANTDWNRFTHYILGREGEIPDARRIERR